MSLGESERITQNRVIKFFKDILKYNYIGNLHDKINSNIIEDRLVSFLQNKYSNDIVQKVILKFKEEAGNIQKSIYDVNKEVYNLLRYGVNVKQGDGKPPINVYLIDFENFENNEFAIAEEVTLKENDAVKRPDLVIYINGIAIAVIELKRSSVAVINGIRQNIMNQQQIFIERFFSTIQYCMAANELEGLYYGTILTKENYYLYWKEDGFKNNEEQDEIDKLIVANTNALPQEYSSYLYKQLYYMYYKDRFLDLIHNFIIYDKGIKKVCRYNQYYGVKRAQKRIHNKQNGIIWHTQGSGKTLTMVWLSQWILENNPNARILIITDREELDDQIEKVYKGVNKQITRTKSGKDLIDIINKYDERLICSLIHKFGQRDGEPTNDDMDKYIESIKNSLPKNFKPKGDFYVFVDECHRTQSGKLHQAMKTVLNNAVMIGFTGTPLLKKDKATSIEVFGSYIHTYKFNEAVEDKVILDLRYEYRDIPQELTSKDRVDAWFEEKTKGLSDRAKAKLKEKWANMQSIYSSKSRLEKIVWDIEQDFEFKPRLSDGYGNAILIANDIYSACKYYELFQSRGFDKCAVISSYEPRTSDVSTDKVGTEQFHKYEIYKKMLNGKDAATFEKEVKDKFINEPANMKLLIVVAKLLTGFDAPPCTYLYIDKSMQDHDLFQAICRVNRLDGETKDFGYIVDYKQLFGPLSDSMTKYTSDAFEGYDAKDIEGLIKNRGIESINDFENILNELIGLCDGVELPKTDKEYMLYFCGAIEERNEEQDAIYLKLREKLYKLVAKLIRAFAEAKPYLVDKYDKNKIEEFEKKVKFFIELKESVGTYSGDFLDFKKYEPDMRRMIDNFINAGDSIKISEFNDLSLLEFIQLRAKEVINNPESKKQDERIAEIIENNITRELVERIVVNPKYYNDISDILKNLIDERKKAVDDYKKLIDEYISLTKLIVTPETNDKYPETIKKSRALMSIYDNTGENEQLAIQLHNAVLSSKQDGFRGDTIKENRIKKELYKILNDENKVESLYKIIVAQDEY